MKFLGSLFLLLLSAVGHAQVFPVQGNLQIAPPYSPFLTDYTAPGTQKLALQLRSNDIDLGDHPIRFRLTIEGAGIAIRTKPNYVPPSPYTLAGDGALSIFYGEDLLDYFNPDRLDFAGFSPREFRQSGKLPEGLYQFSFEVFDYYRQIALSHKITLAVWIVLNDPPLLNLPRHNTTVALLDPVNVAFAWTPRHSSSPNAAAGSEYVFKLVEIWPADRNPYDAFLTQPPLYETVVSEPQLLYGPAEPALIPGRKYAWQVQARDENGRDIFKNQGKSEVYAFQFGDALSPPENVRKEGNSHQAIALLWEPPSKGETPAQYNIRHKAVSAARWQETFTDKQWVALSGLQPGTDYEVQVRSKRDDRYSDYANLLRLKTAERPAEFVCGQPPPPRKPTDKTTRLLRLRTGDSVACNDWRIVVTEITKSSIGEYSGKGMMPVKMFNGANIKVTFHGVVNADYQLITGGVESVYDKDSPMALAVEEMKKIGEHKESLPAAPIDTAAVSVISFPGTIDSVYFDKEKKEAVVIDTEGKRTSFPQKTNPATREAKSMQITDAAGNTVIVDKDGTVSRGVNGGGAGGGNAGSQGIAAGNWFKNIMDFLNRYKGNETDKRQAIAWHNKMDSTVNALSKRADVPDNLMKAMLDARQDAKPAWANLEKGADGIRPRGPSADFDDGFTAEDIALCKKNAETAKAVEDALGITQYTADNGTGAYSLAGTHSFVTPAGNLITIDSLKEVRFVSSYPEKIPAGALIGFTLASGQSFVAGYAGFSKFHSYVNTKDKNERYAVKNLAPQAEAYLGYPENCAIKVYAVPSSQVASSGSGAILPELNFPGKRPTGSAQDNEACLKTEEAKGYFSSCAASDGAPGNADKSACYAAAKAMDLLGGELLRNYREVYGTAQNNIYSQAVVRGLAEQLRLFLAEYNKALESLRNTSDAKVALTLLRSWGRSKYETLSAADRLHLLKVLASVNLSDVKNVASVFTAGYGGENVVLALLQHAPAGQSQEICEGLEAAENGKALIVRLLNRMSDWGWGDDHRTKFFVSLHNIFQKTRRAAKENVSKNDVYYLSSYEEPAICHKEGPLNVPLQSLRDNGQITLRQNYGIDTLCVGNLGKEIKINSPKTYKAFDAIGLVYYRYPSAAIAPQGKEGQLMIYPAIFMKYHNEEWRKNVTLQFGADAGQLTIAAVGFAQLQYLGAAWRILAAAEAVVNSADFAIRNPSVRSKIQASSGGETFLKYWDRGVLATNVLALSPFAARYLYSAVKQYKIWKAGKNLTATLGNDAAKLEADMTRMESTLGVAGAAGSYAKSLAGILKNTYDGLVRAGYKVIDDGSSIIFKNVKDLPIAKISGDALHIKIPDNHGGWAKQSNTTDAISALNKVNSGEPLYRIGTLNHSAAAEAQYWSLENPLNTTDIKVFTQKYGIPKANLKQGDFFVEIAKPKPGIPKISREAPGAGGNAGGSIEIVVPPNMVTLESFHTIKF